MIIGWLLDTLRLFVDYWYFHGKEEEKEKEKEEKENWDIYTTARRAASSLMFGGFMLLLLGLLVIIAVIIEHEKLVELKNEGRFVTAILTVEYDYKVF